MDASIRDLKKTTFHGRRLTRPRPQKTVEMSRNELALTVCEHLTGAPRRAGTGWRPVGWSGAGGGADASGSAAPIEHTAA